MCLIKIACNYGTERPNSIIQTIISKVSTSSSKLRTWQILFTSSRDDIVKLDWLPVKERKEFNYLKLTHKAIHSDNWPGMNKLEIKTTGRALRSSDEINFRHH